MTAVVPSGLTESTLTKALEGFAGVVGFDAVLTSDEELQDFRDPYTHPELDEFVPSAAVLPASVADVQEILRIANEYGIPLWTSSQGRNYGYGGAAPRVRGAVCLSLRRMKRVLEINEECAYAVVEPGVRFFDLYDAVRESGARLWISVPDLGWGSVIGNAVDHGFGYTPYGEHASMVCGMEIVLANGDVVRTGMGAMTNGASWHVYRRGFGPSYDGMFMQSNFGIVTKMGVWLMPTPESFVSGSVSVERDSDLEPLVDTLRPLMLDRTISNYPIIANALSAAAMSGQRSRWYDGDGPDEVVQAIESELGVGRWNMRFGVYGRDDVVDAQFAAAKEAFSRIRGARVDGRKYRGDVPPEEVEPPDRSQAGIPALDFLEAVKWRGGENGGHLGFSPVAPLTGAHARRQYDLLRPIVERFGFDYLGGIITMPRCLVQVFEFVYDTSDRAQAEGAYAACRELVTAAGAAGYGEYRAHPSVMDIVAQQYDFGDHALMRLNETIKDALDPNGILSPGKQGIWPRSVRDGRAVRDGV